MTISNSSLQASPPTAASAAKIPDKKTAEHTIPLSGSHPKQTFFRKYYSQIVIGVEIIIDFMSLFSTFLLARFVYDVLGLERYAYTSLPPLDHTFFLTVGVTCTITVAVFMAMGLYTKKMSILNIDEMRKLVRSVLLIAILVFTISFYFRIPFSRMLVTVWLALAARRC